MSQALHGRIARHVDQRRRLLPWLGAVFAIGLTALWAGSTRQGSSAARATVVSLSASGSDHSTEAGRVHAPVVLGAASSEPLVAPSPPAVAAIPVPPESPPFGEVVSGQVVDALGGVIAGATLSALHESSPAPLATAVTQADGRFELRVPAGALRVIAQADGYSTALLRAIAPASGLMLSLAPAAVIFGRVLDGANQPVSGVAVQARAPWRPDAFATSVVTDLAGTFRLDALTAGEYQLSATGDRLSGELQRIAVNVADEVGPIELRVERGVHVMLDVERGGRACMAGWVNLSAGSFHAAREIESGRVLFEGVPRGEYDLQIGCQDAAYQARVLRVGDRDLTEKVDIDPLLALRGRVVNAEGLGIAGLQVTVAPKGTPEERALMTCQSGPAGEFLCDGLSTGSYRCHVGLELQQQSDFVEILLSEGAPPAPLELRLRPRAALVVSLEHAPADRLLAARVLARPEQGPALAAERRGSEFHFDGLLLGAYEVYLEDSPGTRRNVRLELDGQRVAVSLPWPEMRSISGVVLDEQGQPANEVWVRATAEGGGFPFAALAQVGVPALTDAAGRFHVMGLFEGRYHLRAEAVQREGFAQSVPSGTSDVVIHVAPSATAEERSTPNESKQQ